MDRPIVLHNVTTSSIARKMNTILEPLMNFYHFRKKNTMSFKTLMFEDPPFVALITEVKGVLMPF